MATTLITGCNRGIGLELARQFRERGDDVIGACRNAGPGLEALGIRIIEGIDVADGDSVSHLGKQVGDQRIDVLVNNAGILRGDNLESLDFDTMQELFRVNTLGPLRVTRELLGNLAEGSKVAIVSSRVGSIEDNGSGGNYGYRASKAAVNMVGVNLHHDLGRRGIAVVILHPGLVATDMTGGAGIPPAQAAAGLIERIDELSPETSGTFWHAEGYRLPW